MSIQNVEDKIKPPSAPIGPETVSFDETGHIEKRGFIKRFFFGLLFILVGILAFGLGRLSTLSNKSDVKIEFDSKLGELSPVQGNLPEPGSSSSRAGGLDKTASVNQAVTKTTSLTGEVFASSKGKRYYYPGCKNTISAKNKVSFASKEMAEKAGYTLAANCKPR